LVERNIRLTAGASSYSLLALPVYVVGTVVFGYYAYQADETSSKTMFAVLAGLLVVVAVAHVRVLLSRRRVA